MGRHHSPAPTKIAEPYVCDCELPLFDPAAADAPLLYGLAFALLLALVVIALLVG